MARGIKVPISLKALVVDGPTGAFAGPTSAPPLSDGAALAAGVHLDWALPDALTQGEPVAGTSRVLFPPVPDRWLVVRYWRPTSTSRQRARAWWVDARAAAATPVETPPPSPGSAARPRLTAVGFQAEDGTLLDDDGVTPLSTDAAAFRSAWAVYHPDTGRRFGFHDPLDDAPVGALSYQVIGFYSRVAEDPLHAEGDAWSRWSWLEQARWRVDGLPPPPAITRPEVGVIDVGALLGQEVRLPDEGLIRVDLQGMGLHGVLGDLGPIDPVDPAGGLDRPLVDAPAIDRPRVDAPLTDRPALARPGADRDIDAGLASRPAAPGLDPLRRAGPTAALRVDDVAARVRLPDAAARAAAPAAPPPAHAAAPPDRAAPPDDLTLRPEIQAIRREPTPAPSALLSFADRLVGATDDPTVAKALHLAGAGAELPPRLRDALVVAPGPLFDVLAESDDGYPDRIYCHGQILELRNAGAGGVYDDIGPARPDADLAFTVGTSTADAVAQLLAADPTERWLLAALTSLRVPDMGALAGLPAVAQHLHQQSFQPLDGGHDLAELPDPDFDRLAAEVERLPEGRLRAELTAAGIPDNVVSVALALREDGDPSGRVLLTGLAEAAGLVGPKRKATLGAASRPLLSGWKARAGRIAGRTSLRRVGKELADELPTLGVSGRSPSGRRTVRRPRPRRWTPRAPVVLIHGPKRSWRRGEDGRFDAEGYLTCRLTGERVESIELIDGVPLTSNDLLESPPFLAGMPTTVRELVREAPLLDPGASDIARAALFERASTHPALFTALMPSVQAAERAFRTEATFWWASGLKGVSGAEVAALSRYQGRLPSLLAMEPWRQAWDPVFVEYEARFWPVANPLSAAFSLGEVEHEPKAVQLAADPITLRGRAVPSSVAASSLATALRALSETASDDLARAADEAEQTDVLSFALDGLDRELRARGHALRAGALRITRLRLVDVFGQAIELDVPGRELVIQDEQIPVPGGGRGWLLAPRLPREARLLLRLLAGEADARDVAAPEAGADRPPLCGFLVADHLDHAVEVFDADGASLGQLRHAGSSGTEVLWEPAPGAEPALGDQAAGIANPWLRQLVQGVLDFNRVPFDPPAGQPDETALSALIRVLDTARHTVHATGATAEHLSTLVGRPVAVVRAAARLELPDAGPVPPGLELRLGSLSQPDDGLLAYFAGDDFHRLHPPHASVRTHARESGPGRGYLGGQGAAVRPIHHPYVVVDPTVDLPDTRPVPLVLLMDPGGGVHATTGVLPRKRVALDKEQVERPLARLSPTFRVGPVLVDPARLGLPVPALERFTWEWVRRTDPPGTPDNWDTVAVAEASDAAMIPEGAASIHEGWLRLRPDPG